MNFYNFENDNQLIKIFYSFFLFFFFINLIISLSLTFSVFSITLGLFSILTIYFLSFYYIVKINNNRLDKIFLSLFILISLLFWIFSFFPALNGNDDLKAYLFFLEKTTIDGSLTIDPLSARRMYSLGGLFPLQGSLSYFNFSLLSIIEPSLGILLTSVSIMFFVKNIFTKIVCLTILFFSPLLGSKVLANTIGVYILIFYTFTILNCYSLLIKKDLIIEKIGISIIILALTLSLAIKPIPLIFNSLIFFFLCINFLINKKLNINKFILSLVLFFICCLYLYPFVISSWESSGTLLYPILGDGFRTPAELSPHKFDTYNNINSIGDLTKFLSLIFKDIYFIIIFFAVILTIKKKNLFLNFSILISYFIFYIIILFTVGDDIYLVQRYSFPVSFSLILFMINSLLDNNQFTIDKKKLFFLSTIVLFLVFSFSFYLKGDQVNQNRKSYVKLFSKKETLQDLKKISFLKEKNLKILISSKHSINLYKNGFTNLVIFDAPFQVMPWKNNKNYINDLTPSSLQKNLYKYLRNQNINYIIIDNRKINSNELIDIFLSNYTNSLKLNNFTLHKLIY